MAIDHKGDKIAASTKLTDGAIAKTPATTSEIVGPPWLMPLMNVTFYLRCHKHMGRSKNECNTYCLDCLCIARCSICVTNDHKGHRILQIRKSSNHNSVRVSEVEEILDVAEVQTYVINHAQIIFLKERPQGTTTPLKAVSDACESCRRKLPGCYRFCSIGCKFGWNRKKASYAFVTNNVKTDAFQRINGGTPGWNSESENPSEEGKTKQRRGYDDYLKEDASRNVGGLSSCKKALNCAGVAETESPPIVNCRKRTRKGIPHRSPLF